MTRDTTELTATYRRLGARLKGKGMEGIDLPHASMEQHVTYMAQLLGAKDPYLAVLYPDFLDAILANKQPEWMESGFGMVDIEA